LQTVFEEYNFHMSEVLIIFGVLLITQLISAKEARAYLDPGTGSYLIQILVASLAALGLTVSHYWSRIKSAIFKKNNKRKNNGDDT
jgi:hypothetical protein